MKYVKTFEKFDNDEVSSEFLNSPQFIKSVKKASEKVNKKQEVVDMVESEYIPYFSKLIDSNNIKEIKKTIDNLPKNLWLHSIAFLYQQIRIVEEKIKKKKPFKIDNSINFDELRDKINEISNRYKVVYDDLSKVDDELIKLVRIIVNCNDLQSVRLFDGYITHMSVIARDIYQAKINEMFSKNKKKK